MKKWLRWLKWLVVAVGMLNVGGAIVTGLIYLKTGDLSSLVVCIFDAVVAAGLFIRTLPISIALGRNNH